MTTTRAIHHYVSEPDGTVKHILVPSVYMYKIACGVPLFNDYDFDADVPRHLPVCSKCAEATS